uniref:Putative secreted protein n=1 Tax=Ixodes ricinus TaxID=34613 RepID=A0A6B0UB83_IXORI
MCCCLFLRVLYSTRAHPAGYATSPVKGSQSRAALLVTVRPSTFSSLTRSEMGVTSRPRLRAGARTTLGGGGLPREPPRSILRRRQGCG